MQTGRDRAKPQCYRPLDEPGGTPLPFAFYLVWQQQVAKNDRDAQFRNRAKYGQNELASPERALWSYQPRHPLPRSGSVQRGAPPLYSTASDLALDPTHQFVNLKCVFRDPFSDSFTKSSRARPTRIAAARPRQPSACFRALQLAGRDSGSQIRHRPALAAHQRRT